jgi:hypothetical protein
VQSGQAGQLMFGQLTGLGDVAFANYGDWTARIAKGELPFAKPPRPQGVERNIVVTLRDWMNEKQYLHDLIASDRRFPTVNAYGPLIGSPEYSSDTLPLLDPVKNVATTFVAPVRDTSMPLSLGPGHAAGLDALQPSPYWDNERIWETRANNHNSMFGRDGRVWLAASVRARRTRRSARRARIIRRPRRSRWTAPSVTSRCSTSRRRSTASWTRAFRRITCSSDTTRTRRCGRAVAVRSSGWVNTKMFDKTGDAAQSQGWTALVLDTNGNGKRDAYVEPDEKPDPTKDTRINSPFYAVMPSPADGSIWGATMGVPGAVVRIAPGLESA